MFFGLDEVYVTKINVYIFVSDVSQKMIYVDLEASSPDQDFTHPYDKNSESDFFFCSTKIRIFFSATLGIRTFF
jgi:hypothetical protein